MTRLRVIGDVSINRPLPPQVAELLHHPDGGEPDLVIGNLEIPLTDSGWPADKVSVSRSEPRNVDEYAALGADLWTIATNHALDWGVPGLQETLRLLRAAGVSVIGAGSDRESARAGATLVSRSGATVAVLNYCSTLPSGSAATDRRPGVSALRIGQSFEFEAARMEEQPGSPPRMTTWPLEQDLLDAVEETARAAANHDLVVVCLHWGVAWPFLPANQGPLADYQGVVARRLVEAGARVIVGTHPHALHPVEFIGDAVVLYSLGNFLFHEEPALRPDERRVTPAMHPILRSGPWFEGAVVDVVLTGSRVDRVVMRPIALDRDGVPAVASESEAERIIASVREQSPDVRVDIEDGRGVITR